MPLADPGAVAGMTEDKKRYPRARSIGSGVFFAPDRRKKVVKGGKRKPRTIRHCFGSREGSVKLPPPSDCNRDECRTDATVRRDGKARRVG